MDATGAGGEVAVGGDALGHAVGVVDEVRGAPGDVRGGAPSSAIVRGLDRRLGNSCRLGCQARAQGRRPERVRAVRRGWAV